VIAILPCGFDLPRTRREAVALTRQPGWSKLRAVRAGRVFGVDGNQYFNRPGPRLVDSLEMLAEMLHGQIFREEFQGLGWERLQT
jgi:iron complex transport system substrate-binding protein